MDFISRSSYLLVGFFLTLGFGIWLSRRGKPYPGLLFNIHKLIALGTVILTALALYQVMKSIDAQAGVLLSLLAAGISVAALFTSGALMSAGKGEYQVMKVIHIVAPFVLIFSMALALISLDGGA